MKHLLVLLLFLCSTSVFAQDVIVKKDGSTILSKVLEINKSDIKYKKFSNQNGPTYTIEKSEILAINYENGDKDTFDSESKAPESPDKSQSNRYIQKEADDGNAEILAFYNKDYQPTERLKKSKKKIEGYMMIFGVKTSSVLSNEDLEITFIRKVTDPAEKSTTTRQFYEHVVYNINIKNKTNRTIYIDKGNCYRIMDDGSSYCFYEPTEQTTVNTGSNSGASIGLGALAGAFGIGGIAGGIASGISVGGERGQSVSTTYTPQRVIAIPAHGQKLLLKEKSVMTQEGGTFKRYHYQLIEKAENFDFKELCSSQIKTDTDVIDMGGTYCTGFHLPKDLVKMGEVINYNEDNSPYSRQYILTYSTDEFFETYSAVKADIYLRQIFGCEKLRRHCEIQSKKYIDGLNKYTIEGYYTID